METALIIMTTMVTKKKIAIAFLQLRWVEMVVATALKTKCSIMVNVSSAFILEYSITAQDSVSTTVARMQNTCLAEKNVSACKVLEWA